jgi:heme exporter protein B
VQDLFSRNELVLLLYYPFPLAALKRLIVLFTKDLLLEIRLQYSFYGILLYVAATVFVLYLAMGQPESPVWNAMYWMIQLFVCVNAVAKSFLQENQERLLYFYSLVGAREFILSKLLFNGVLMMALSLVSLVLFQLWLGDPLIHPLRFLAIACFGGLSISLLFTFLAAIASRAGHSAALMAIMGFPIIIPQLLLLIRSSQMAFADLWQPGLYRILLLLAAFDVLVVVLAVILFPFLWKD